MLSFFNRKIPSVLQIDLMDCGPACIKIVGQFYGVHYDIGYLRNLCQVARQGVSIYHLSNAFEKLGYNTNCVKIKWDDLKYISLPCVIHWKNSHFVLLFAIKNKYVIISDPSKGIIKYTIAQFLDGWLGKDDSWVVLEVEPTPEIKKSHVNRSRKIIDYFQYIAPYRKYIILLLFLILFLTVLQSLIPFISRSIIDIGLRTQDQDFLLFALIGNLTIILSSTIGFLFRDSLMTNISSRSSISIGVSYLKKLMALPLAYYESKLPGDWLQKVSDNEKIKIFLLTNGINIIFSGLSFVVFSAILFFYDLTIGFTVLLFVASYLVWVFAFLKIKKKSEWQYAEVSVENQGFWVNTINHFIDYKLNDFNSINITKWRNNQVKSFKHFFRLNQINGILSSGSSMILQVCNQVVVFLSVKALIDGAMTFGSMIAIQILIGMLYNPLLQIMSFFVELQATKLSFKRVNELNFLPSEMAINNLLALDLTNNKEISLTNVIFQYPNSTNVVLKGINFRILQSKMIVILGDSGSGKSTLLKIILGLYSPTFGDVFVGNTNLKAVNLFEWRKLFGVVTQESKIISGSILENITMSHENQDLVRVKKIVDIVCFSDDISNFYQGYDTVIGEGGRGLSEGQKQKLLIARALYSNPFYLILDEATNSLDITVENRIMNNIRENFENITILFVAHRPQLAKIADLVIVIENGQVVENDFREKLELNEKSYFSKLIRS